MTNSQTSQSNVFFSIIRIHFYRRNKCVIVSFEAEYCLFCGRRRVAVARYRMICLVLVQFICRAVVPFYLKKIIYIATYAGFTVRKRYFCIMDWMVNNSSCCLISLFIFLNANMAGYPTELNHWTILIQVSKNLYYISNYMYRMAQIFIFKSLKTGKRVWINDWSWDNLALNALYSEF